MELLRSLTVDAAPSVVELFRFALISSLEMIRKVLLLYPLNVAILTLLSFLIFYKIIAKLLPKPKFNLVYAPLKHHENSSEELKILKR